MATPQQKHDLLIEVSLMLSALVFIPILIGLLPSGITHAGSPAHFWFNILWWTCMAIVAWICFVKTKGNFLGACMCILLGPISLLALGFYWLGSRWIFKTKTL
jgi:hypothetical protein